MKNKIQNYIKAGYPGLFIITSEEQRVEAELTAVARDLKFKLHSWSLTSGIVSVEAEPQAIAETQEPHAMLTAFDAMEENTILVLRDFHMMLQERSAMLFRKLKDTLTLAKAQGRTLIILGCTLALPPELEKEVIVLDMGLPNRETLKLVMDGIAESAKVKIPKGNLDDIIDAASGLTTIEAENAFSLSIVETGGFDKIVIGREKANTIKKNGLLEIVESKTTLADIGGLEVLKTDLNEKRNLFTKEAREYGLPAPRGILVCGQPGTGKSLTATATSSIFGIPLIRLEAGKLFGSLVGQSEANWRGAFATAKAVAPCVLWIDEVEGLFCGAQSSGQTDSGVTNRVIKAILQDMQFNSDGIFYMFTANDIDGLPDPLIDRLDVWSVDLPTQTERESIISIHIKKRGRNPDKFDIPALAKGMDGFSGRQIEQVWLKALTLAFNDGARQPTNKDFIAAASRVVPTSKTMADAIEKRRKRLENRATPASAPEAVAKAGGRKITK